MHALNARLILILANHIGDNEALMEALAIARATGPGGGIESGDPTKARRDLMNGGCHEHSGPTEDSATELTTNAHYAGLYARIWQRFRNRGAARRAARRA